MKSRYNVLGAFVKDSFVIDSRTHFKICFSHNLSKFKYDELVILPYDNVKVAKMFLKASIPYKNKAYWVGILSCFFGKFTFTYPVEKRLTYLL